MRVKGEATLSSKTDVPCIGNALSFALRLRKRKSGTAQTQIAKKDAISPKVGIGSGDWYIFPLTLLRVLRFVKCENQRM